jgi:hypothetical protein
MNRRWDWGELIGIHGFYGRRAAHHPLVQFAARLALDDEHR